MRNWIFALAVIVIIGLSGMAVDASDGIITKEELRNELENPDLVVLDVRTGRDWKSSEFKIKGAVRANPGDFDQWIAQHAKNKKFVTYCA